MSRTYSKRTCRCGREISSNGLSWHNHMMAHVRKGEATVQSANDGHLRHSGISTQEFRWLQPKK